MSKFQIIFEKEKLFRSSSGAITAPIYFDWGEGQFPENGWSDFVVIITCWWIDELLNIIGNQSCKAELSFMDGPMLVRVDLIEESLVVECVDQRKLQEVVDYQTVIGISEFVSQLKITAFDILDVCSNNGWQSDDIRRLQMRLKDLDVLVTTKSDSST